MEETIIKFNRNKRLRLLFFSLIIIIVVVLYGYYMVYIKNRFGIMSIGLCVLGFLAGIWSLYSVSKSILSNDQDGLIVNTNGIHFKGTSLGRNVGVVNWKDVNSISVRTVLATKFVVLYLDNVAAYKARLTPNVAHNSNLAEGFPISADELSIDYDNLNRLIINYYNENKK